MSPEQILFLSLVTHRQGLKTVVLQELFNPFLTLNQLEMFISQMRINILNKVGLELVETNNGYRLQTITEFSPYLEKLSIEKQPKYSRSALETLAIIVHKQPVTRGDIEDIRGVSVSSDILKNFQERGWIEVIGKRQTVGYPSLWATTEQFLNDHGLKSLADFPVLEKLEKLESTENIEFNN